MLRSLQDLFTGEARWPSPPEGEPERLLTFTPLMRLEPARDLVTAIQQLSLVRSIAEVQAIVRAAARRLTNADGATFVLRDNEECYYVDEDAISPLWKGQRFPLDACISGWSMLNRRPALIEDIYADDRIPHDAYRPTFVQSLAMVPIRTLAPIGAIGNYWASRHQPTEHEVELLQALADSTAVAIENVRAYEALEEARLDTLRRLALVAEYRDDTTHRHTERVGNTAAVVAAHLGTPLEEVELIRLAAPLHDIGKIAVPDEILLKPGKLTREEMTLMRRHTIVGARILTGSRHDVLQLAEMIALFHHERWDGGGYQQGLRGAEIPLCARIVALADSFDALTHDRPYKPAWPLPRALHEIRSQRGKQFDPDLVDALLELDMQALAHPAARPTQATEAA